MRVTWTQPAKPLLSERLRQLHLVTRGERGPRPAGELAGALGEAVYMGPHTPSALPELPHVC